MSYNDDEEFYTPPSTFSLDASPSSSYDFGLDYGSSTSPSSSYSGPSFSDLTYEVLLSKEGLSGLLGMGATYLTNSAKLSAQDKLAKQQQEAEKFKALLDYEKLKYQINSKAASGSGNRSGGSGSGAQNRATLISALASAKNGQSDALGNLSTNLGTIYGR